MKNIKKSTSEIYNNNQSNPEVKKFIQKYFITTNEKRYGLIKPREKNLSSLRNHELYLLKRLDNDSLNFLRVVTNKA